MFAQDLEAVSGGFLPAWLDTQLDEVQEEVAEFRGRHDELPSRRVVLVPQSPQGTPQSFGDKFSQKRSGGLILSQAVVSAPQCGAFFTKMKWVCPVRTPRLSERFLRCPCKLHLQCQKWCQQWRRFIVSPAIRDALIGLDTLDVGNNFQTPDIHSSPPKFLCGAFRSALRVALLEMVKGCRASGRGDPVPGLETLLVVASHAVVQTPAGVATSRSSEELNVSPLSHVANGKFSQQVCDEAAAQGFQRRRRTHVDWPPPPPEQRQAISDNFQPPSVGNVELGDVEVTDHDVRRDSAACLPTDRSGHSLQRAPPPSQDPSPCARSHGGWPRRSRGRPHRQKRADKVRGRLRRRRRTMRKS